MKKPAVPGILENTQMQPIDVFKKFKIENIELIQQPVLKDIDNTCKIEKFILFPMLNYNIKYFAVQTQHGQKLYPVMVIY